MLKVEKKAHTTWIPYLWFILKPSAKEAITRLRYYHTLISKERKNKFNTHKNTERRRRKKKLRERPWEACSKCSFF